LPYADMEKQKEYQRNWQRKKQTNAVKTEKNFLNPDPATARQLLAILTAALQDIVDTEADPIIRGRAIAYLVNVGLKGVEISSLEERLQALEEEINGNQGKN
jgi:hypothetical protein